MRKTSQDGGDSTSITSAIENDTKKSGAILKTKRNSIKRKVQNFSLESDDAVIEPLLQKDKENTEIIKQSAKYNLLSKTKTEVTSERGTDKDKLISDDKLQREALTNASVVTDSSLPASNLKETSISKFTSANAPLHNHMNTNVFSNHDGLKTFATPKTQILVEIDGSKHVGYNPSPLIFTTAKIHTDGKTKHMEPVQMTPVPILSTIEVSVKKTGINAGETSGHLTSNISAVYIPETNKNITEQDLNLSNNTIINTPTPQNKVSDQKIQMFTDKADIKSNTGSVASSSNTTKLIRTNLSTTNVKDNNIPENKYINNENKIDKEECHIQTHTSQPVSSSLEENKNIIPQEAKSGAASTSKNKDNVIYDQPVITKNVSDAIRYPENKATLNKTFKPDSLDCQRTKLSDNVSSSDITSKDKTKDMTSSSFSSRQLQHQNIVLDKNDPITKLKSNMVSPPQSGECQKRSEINTLSNITKLPKSSANCIPVSNVTSVLTKISGTDKKTSTSTTTAAALTKKPSPTTSNSAINQTAALVIDSAIKNTAITTNASASKEPFPTISSANKTFDTTTSNAKKISTATTKVAVPITAAAAMKTISASINTTAVTNTVTPSKVSSTSSTSSIKIISPSTSFANSNKIPPILTTALADNKISTTSTTAAASNKISAHSPITGSKISKAIITTETSNKISAIPTTSIAGNKIFSPSSITTAGSKISSPSITTAVGNKSSSISTCNEIPFTSTDNTTINKISTSSSTVPAGNKISAPFTTLEAGNKLISLSTPTTAATNKISGPVITTTATKVEHGSTATTSGVKISTSNASSASKPITTSSSTLLSFSNTPITKPAIGTTFSVSKPSNVSIPGNENETSTTKPQVTSINIKPTSSTMTTKQAKITTVSSPITTSQQTTVLKSPIVTTAKSVTTKTISQPAISKSTEITPKSSTSNEKSLTAKSSSSTIRSTTTSGTSNVTSISGTSASSGSILASTEANKESVSKSKVISNDSKSFKA